MSLYTVLDAAKLNGLDPEVYLTNIIDRMARGHPARRLKEPLPWNWAGEENTAKQTVGSANFCLAIDNKMTAPTYLNIGDNRLMLKNIQATAQLLHGTNSQTNPQMQTVFQIIE